VRPRPARLPAGQDAGPRDQPACADLAELDAKLAELTARFAAAGERLDQIPGSAGSPHAGGSPSSGWT
jgi:hypothetical protein